MTAAILLAVALAPAAPVPPPSPNADRERLELLWSDLASHDPVNRTAAAFALADHPAAVPFLVEKAPPVKASAAEIKGWLADLNSDDEKTGKTAFDKLRYFDPRIELTPVEQLEQINSDDGRRLLASLWWGELIQVHAGFVGNRLTIDGHDAFTFAQHYRGGIAQATSSDHNGTLFSVSQLHPNDWRRAALAAIILDRINTRASREALLQLADGHRDALPTRTAVAAIRARFALPSPPPDRSWAKLLDFDPVETIRWAFELADHPERVNQLRARLPAIKATKDEVTGWLKALNSEKPEDWKPAFEKLLYFRPQLALSVDHQCPLMTSAHGRTALLNCSHDHTRLAEEFVANPKCVLEISNYADGRSSTLDLMTPLPNQRGFSGCSAELQPLSAATPSHWQRARIAILALQRANTPAARAVLKQLADGHPDILPTKEAKAALK